MNNSYIIASVIVLAAILGFVFASKKTEAPIEKVVEDDNTEVVSTLTDGTYKLDLTSSKVGWQGEYLSGLTEEGTVQFESGEFTVSGGVITGGEFVVDLNTIQSNPPKEKLVAHLKNEDFFSVDKFPTAKFTLKKMLPSSESSPKSGRYVFAGDMTIRGITKPISFVANITTDSTNQNILMAGSSFAINRADWEIKYNSPTFFSNLGDKIIRDAVSITLDLKGEKVIQ